MSDLPKPGRGIFVALGVFVLLWVGTALLPVLSLTLFPELSKETHDSFKDVLEQYAAFGDMFNLLNTLFTAAALAGVVYTSLLQRQQMTMQIEELRMAKEAEAEAQTDRAELRRQAAEEKRMALNASILNAKVALLLANSQLSGAPQSPGKVEQQVETTKSHMVYVQETLAAYEAELSQFDARRSN